MAPCLAARKSQASATGCVRPRLRFGLVLCREQLRHEKSAPGCPPSAANRRRVRSTRMDLNPAQSEAVHTLSGPLLVLAGAGTGKTRVVTYRIAELIRRRTPPDRILAVTFTNKAADEMQQRAAALLGKRLERKPEISTFHSLCVRILRRHITQLGYPAGFAIYDRGDQEGVARVGPAGNQGGRGPAAAGRPALFHRPLEDGRRRPRAGGRAGRDRQGAPGRLGLPPLPERPAGGRGRRFRRLAAVASRNSSGGGPRSAPPRPAASTTSWSTNTRTPTAANTASSRPWPPATATCASWATTTSRSTAGGAPRSPTSSASRRIGPTPRSSAWKPTTARPAKSSPGPIGSSPSTASATPRCSAPPSAGQPPRVLQLEDEIKEAKTVVDEIAARIRPAQTPAPRLRHPLPHQRAAAGVRDGTPPRQDPLRPLGRHVVLRPQGGPRHAGLSQGPGQSPRRGLAAADHQHAAPRHRAHGRQAADGAGHRPGQAAVGGAAAGRAARRWRSFAA